MTQPEIGSSLIKKVASFSSLILCCLCAAFVSDARAHQDDSKSWRLQRLEVSGLERHNRDEVITASGLKTGQVVTIAILDKALAQLKDTGLFKSVGYGYSYKDDQIEVTFEVKEEPWETPVVFDNFVWFTDQELQNIIRQSVPFFSGKAPASGRVLDKIKDALQRLLEEKDIPAEVEHTPFYELSRELKANIFQARGNSLLICAVRFQGSGAVKETDLLKASRPLMNVEYSRSFVADFINQNLIPIYRERGHLKVRFADAQAKPDSGPNCESGVSVLLEVAEGPVYFWQQARWSGNAAIEAQELDSLLKMKTGELANGLKLDAGLESVRAQYQKRGFIDVKLKVEPTLDDTSRQAGYNIAVGEGDQYRMGKLILKGLSEKEAGSLIKRWKIAEGEIYDATYINQYIEKELPVNKKPASAQLKRNRQNGTVDVEISF